MNTDKAMAGVPDRPMSMRVRCSCLGLALAPNQQKLIKESVLYLMKIYIGCAYFLRYRQKDISHSNYDLLEF